MAFKSLQLDEMPPFGRRLMGLARGKGFETPGDIAQALYESYIELVKPAIRRNKHGKIVKSPENDIKAIVKSVQSHLNETEAARIHSKFIYAYCLLFNCSADYLYGLTEVISQDMDVRRICEKTGLSENAVINLIEHNDSDPNVFSFSSWWSGLLEDQAFFSIPMDWYKYSTRVLERQDLQNKIDAINKALAEVDLDPIIRSLQEMRPDTLERLKSTKEDECYGAFGKMIRNIQNYIEGRTAVWLREQHTNFGELYYHGEINKMKILEAEQK